MNNKPKKPEPTSLPVRGDGPKPFMKESQLLTACKRILRLLENSGLLAFRRIHVMPVIRSIRGRKVFTRNQDMAGMADLLVFLPSQKVLHLELKTEKGVRSREQFDWATKLLRMGHDYRVVSSVQEMENALKAHGIDHWSFTRPQVLETQEKQTAGKLGG